MKNTDNITDINKILININSIVDNIYIYNIQDAKINHDINDINVDINNVNKIIHSINKNINDINLIDAYNDINLIDS